MTPTDIRLVLVSAPEDAASRIADAVLERRAAACANVLPGAVSRYWWKGALETSREALVFFKTTASGVEAAMRAIREVHPYDVPEILVLSVDEGSAAYLDWVRGEVQAAPRPS